MYDKQLKSKHKALVQVIQYGIETRLLEFITVTFKFKFGH
jgi:hypothetical protein